MLKSSGLKIPGRGPKHSSPVGRTSAGGSSSPVVPKDSKLLPPSLPVENIRNFCLPAICCDHRKWLRPFICVNDSVEHSCIRLYTKLFSLALSLSVYTKISNATVFPVSFQQFGWVPVKIMCIYIFIHTFTQRDFSLCYVWQLFTSNFRVLYSFSLVN